MTTSYEPYFKVIKQIATERGASYSHGTTWAAADSTRDGERVVVEVTFYDGEDGPYYVGEVFEYDKDTPEHADAFMGTDSSELYRKMGAWV